MVYTHNYGNVKRAVFLLSKKYRVKINALFRRFKIDDRFISREYEITLDEIKQFASHYDPQPFHTDEELAKEDPIFKGIAASGWHTSAITTWTECMPIHGWTSRLRICVGHALLGLVTVFMLKLKFPPLRHPKQNWIVVL